VATEVQIAIDSADPHRLARFWATALGYVVQPPPPGFESWEAFAEQAGFPRSEWESRAAVVDPAGKGPRLFFQRVPEPKTVKNRVHLDVTVGGRLTDPLPTRRAIVAAEADRLVAAGASILRTVDQPWGEYWIVMADPEGNEFCLQ
jgi:hypothetical protein